MKFDDILSYLGEFGYYQKRLYLLLCMPAISVGCYMMLLIIITATPKHRCKIPGLDNDTYGIMNPFHQELINLTIPLSNKETEVYDKCHIKLCPDSSDLFCKPENRTLESCTEWVYDKTTFYSTFTSASNLVCDDSLKTSHIQMIFYFGVLVGDVGFGILSDQIGRKKTLYLTVVILLAVALGAVWAPNFAAFSTLQFLIGAANHGAFMVCCVLGLEMVGPSKRVWAGIVIHVFFTVGLLYLAGFSYLLRDWQYIQIAVVAPCALYLSYWWIIPESPRWLISQGKQEEAAKIIQKVAKTNKKMVPEEVLKGSGIEKDEKLPEGRIWHLFSHRVLLIRTLIIFFNWAVVSMIYYGVTMHTGQLGGDFYLNFFLLAVVEFPASFLSIYLLDRIGRKRLHCGCMLLGGIACLCTIFSVTMGGKELEPLTLTLAIIGKIGSAGAFGVIYIFSAELFPTVVRNAGMGASSCVARIGGMVAPYVAKSLEPLTLTLAIIGKIGSAGAFGVIYIFSAELFPTVVRNAGMGASSCVARIGGMVAPYVAKSGEMVGGKFGQALPLVIFGAFSVTAGLLCLFLPETFNQKLPESIEDGIEFGKKTKNDQSSDITVEMNEKADKIFSVKF